MTNVDISNACPCCQQPLPIFDEIVVDMQLNAVIYRGQILKLTRQQADILEILVRRSPGVVLYDALASGLWGVAEPENPTKALDTIYCKLRKRIEPLGLTVERIWGRGLRLIRTRHDTG